jgi:hypothetical protein
MSYIYLVLAGLLAIVTLALLYGRQSRKRGREEASNANLESALVAARKGGAIDEDIFKLSDDDLYDELRNGGRK